LKQELEEQEQEQEQAQASCKTWESNVMVVVRKPWEEEENRTEKGKRESLMKAPASATAVS
jgi:hypothetical protein